MDWGRVSGSEYSNVQRPNDRSQVGESATDIDRPLGRKKSEAGVPELVSASSNNRSVPGAKKCVGKNFQKRNILTSAARTELRLSRNAIVKEREDRAKTGKNAVRRPRGRKIRKVSTLFLQGE